MFGGLLFLGKKKRRPMSLLLTFKFHELLRTFYFTMIFKRKLTKQKRYIVLQMKR